MPTLATFKNVRPPKETTARMTHASRKFGWTMLVLPQYRWLATGCTLFWCFAMTALTFGFGFSYAFSSVSMPSPPSPPPPLPPCIDYINIIDSGTTTSNVPSASSSCDDPFTYEPDTDTSCKLTATCDNEVGGTNTETYLVHIGSTALQILLNCNGLLRI